MSACLCNDETFVTIASLVAPKDVWKVARILKEANLRSMKARYSDEEMPEDISIVVPGGTISRARQTPGNQLMDACACYAYQACEHDSWEGSMAQKLSLGLYEALSNAGFSESDTSWDFFTNEFSTTIN